MREIRRLLFLTDATTFGGAEQYIITCARAAKLRGIEPLVCFTREPSDELRERVSADVPPVQLGQSPRVAVPMPRLSEALARALPDAAIINASGRPGFWLAPWTCRRRGIPAAWVHHMVEGRDHRRARPSLLGGRMEGPQFWRIPQAMRHRMAAVGATAVIVSNDEDRRSVVRWQGVPNRRLHVIPPGIDCDRYRFDEAARRAWRQSWGCTPSGGRDPFVIGTAVRLVSGKGVERLLEAFAMLLLLGRANAWLMIAGTGPLRENLTERARAFFIQDRILLAGSVDDMPGFYSGLDVAVLASDTESFGLTLTEAMACERAVIATPTAGARRQIEHMRTGWLLDDFAPATLTAALEKLASDPELRQTLGAEARPRVIRDFSATATFEQTLAALRPHRYTAGGPGAARHALTPGPAESAPHIPAVR